MSAAHLILASASPRRSELLTVLGVTFTCDPAHIDEEPMTAEPARDYVMRMALEKARAVKVRYLGSGSGSAASTVVLAADTSVIVDGDILGKPESREHALAMLTQLSGREHTVLTAVCVSGEKEDSALVTTEVEFTTIDAFSCAAYLETDEPWDKAGAYGIQGLGGAFVHAIHGSYSNVVGLPLAETRQLLQRAGIATALDTRTTRAGSAHEMQ